MSTRAQRLLQLHRELCESAWQADREGAVLLGALHRTNDPLVDSAARAYRARLRAIRDRVTRLEGELHATTRVSVASAVGE